MPYAFRLEATCSLFACPQQPLKALVYTDKHDQLNTAGIRHKAYGIRHKASILSTTSRTRHKDSGHELSGQANSKL
jgi:hypothetical protein